MNLIEQFVAVLKDYNAHTNIYSRKAYEHLPFHIENSQLIKGLIHLDTPLIADVGSGSGLPSIPLAIYWPQAKVTAIESRSKKVAFLKHVKRELKLTNLEIIHKDVREVFRMPHFRCDIITAKAFSNYETLHSIVRLLKHVPKHIVMPISLNQIKTQYADKESFITGIKGSNDWHYYLHVTDESI